MSTDLRTTPLWLETSSGPWEVVIGLEVHAQVASDAKLFSSAPTSFAADPNSKVSFVDAAFPGMLPVLNKKCVEQAIKTGYGLNAHINAFSMFDRKNYFYADLPQGYQISQLYHPIVGEGHVDVYLKDGQLYRVHIERLHLEQDAGKSIHDLHPTKSCIDLNRCGTALMEIVTKPDMRTAEHAMAFVKKLRLILRYLGSSDGNMEEGSLRADVNISVRKLGEPFGRRVEVKNVNSIRFIGQAIEYESRRQADALDRGETIVQETRLYDPVKGETRPLRSKEDAPDYRYFPDPDLLPLRLSSDYIQSIEKGLPELPDQKYDRLMRDYGLNSYDALFLIDDGTIADFYEQAVAASTSAKGDKTVAKLILNWLMGDLSACLNKDNVSIVDSPISCEALAELVDLIHKSVISGRIAKDVFQEMWTSRKSPAKIVEEKGLTQIVDTKPIEDAADQVIADNPQMVAEFKTGKDKLFGFFVGQVMKMTQGKANPAVVNDVLKKKLHS